MSKPTVRSRTYPWSLASTLAFLILQSCGGGGGSSTSIPPPPPPTPGFSIAVSGATSLAPSQSVVVNISVTPSNGFDSPISVTVSGLPAGITSSPASPFNITNVGQSITLTASSTPTQGTAQISFQATGGGASAAAQLSLLVAPFANFSFGPVNGPLTIRQGSSASDSLFLILGSGAMDFTLQLSLGSLPTGITGSLAPNPAAPNQNITLTLTAAANAPPAQNVPIGITALRPADGAQATATIEINVAPPPGALSNNRTAFVRTDDTPLAIAYDPIHGLIFSSALHLNCVDVISIATQKVITCVPVSGALGVSLSADGSRVLVGTQTSEVAWIDTSSLLVVERDVVPQIPLTPMTLQGLTFVPAAQAFQAANGKVLLLSNWGYQDLFGNFQSATLVEWDPIAGTSTPRPDALGGGLVSMSADHSKILIGGQGAAVVYNSATDTFTEVPGFQSGVYEPAMNPAGTQFVLIDGSPLITFFNAQMNVIGSLNIPGCCTFRPESAVYSPDGQFLYIVVPNPMNELITISTSTFQIVGTAPAYSSNVAYFSSPTIVGHPQAADATGLVFEIADHGVAIDDATDLENFVNPPGSLESLIIATPDEGALGVATQTSITTQSFSSLPDVWFGNQESQAVAFSSGSEISATSPPSSIPGPVNLKFIQPDGVTSMMPQGFTYGSLPLQYGQLASGPAGGVIEDLFGYGFSVDIPHSVTSVTIGQTAATVQSADLFPGNVVYPFPLQHLAVSVPPGTPGPHDISITSPAGSASLPAGFHYLAGITDYSLLDAFQYVLYDPFRDVVYLSAGGHIDVFSNSSRTFLTPIQVPSNSGHSMIFGLSLTPDGSKLLAANNSDLSVAILDPNNPTVGAVVVGLPLAGIQGNPGPFEIATTSTNQAFVTVTVGNTLSGGVSSIYDIDLGSLQVSTASLPFGSQLNLNDNQIRASTDGSVVVEGTPNSSGGPLLAWQAATGQWSTHLVENQFWLQVAISGDGNVVATTSSPDISQFPFAMMFDPLLRGTAQANFPEFQAIEDLNSMDLDQSGALLFVETIEGIDVIDARTGQLRERILLTEQPSSETLSNLSVKRALAVTPTGDEIFYLSANGLTVIQLDSVPLGIGSVSPSAGAAGTAVTVRGSGFVNGTAVTVGGASASVSFVDASTLHVTLPSSLPTGAVQFVLTNPDGSTYSLDAAFTIQ